MTKRNPVISILCILLVILFSISLVRVVNGGDFLSFEQFLTILSEFDINIDFFLDTVNGLVGMLNKVGDSFKSFNQSIADNPMNFVHFVASDTAGLAFAEKFVIFMDDFVRWFEVFGENFRLIFAFFRDLFSVTFKNMVNGLFALIGLLLSPIYLLMDIVENIVNIIIFVLKLLGIPFNWLNISWDSINWSNIVLFG